MGREQGDELGKPTMYTHPDDPDLGERPAYDPTDVVNLEARGWVPKGSKQGKTAGQGAPVRAENG